jgi:predicted GTPase
MASLLATKSLRSILAPAVCIFVLPPLIALGVKGLEALINGGLDLIFWGVWLFALCISAMIFAVIKWKNRHRPIIEIEDYVDPEMDWGKSQSQVWNDLDEFIAECLIENPEWRALRTHGLTVVRATAAKLNKTGRYTEYAATAPEILLMLETLASRYRKTLQDKLPMVDAINISTLLRLYDYRDPILKNVNYATWFYRVTRVVNFSGVLSELANQLFDQLTDKAKQNLFYNLKRAFLKEVAGVSIDLFSGKFKIANDQLQPSTTAKNDLAKLVGKIEPVRVCILGQVSSGKSTLLNTLIKQVKAEVSALPATDRSAVYELTLEEGVVTRIVDTPGLDGNQKNFKMIMAEAIEADIIVWTLKANQSARSLDTELLQAFNDHFKTNKNQFRKRPQVIGVLTHIDKLHDVANIAEPQLDETINPALHEVFDFNQSLLSLDVIAPVANLDGLHWGRSNLIELFLKLHDDAIHTLLNRVRHQTGISSIGLKDLARIGRLTSDAVQLSVKEHP